MQNNETWKGCTMSKFKLKSDFAPTGDQPEAIKTLVEGYKNGKHQETLLGVTGSGKTFTMANVIAELNKPTLILAHNKTLAAQLYSEFKEFFPDNAVEYFVSYYDYYQPEAYVARSDTYIEKDSSINEEIDKLRHSATAALAERSDVIIIASVSCIYGLGSPVDYQEMVISIRPGMEIDRDAMLRKLVEIQYKRNDLDFARSTFRVRGDVVEIFPSGAHENAMRVEFFGDVVERITEINTLTGEIVCELDHTAIFPASHYVIAGERIEEALVNIEEEMIQAVKDFKSEDKLIEAQRIRERTNFDIEMIRETGFCSGIENYSRHLTGLAKGEAPHTLIDYFPEDFLMIVDESHMSIPQVRGMYSGDQSRKQTLVDYGFRLPSAKDNRPLNFQEFEKKIDKIMYVSATPGPYEKEKEELYAEQIIRPTGLIDPRVEIRPVKGQIDNLISEIYAESKKGNKILVTTLTKRMSEDLTDYMKELDIRVRYLHSDINTLERIEIIRDLRLDVFDVLIGINLLREGLDIPEVSLVAIIDADKEGFLRSETALVQTVGRAARNVDGRVIMYADRITGSMERAISETNRRRNIQQKYNDDNNITPVTIKKAVRDLIKISRVAESKSKYVLDKDPESMDRKELEVAAKKISDTMKRAALDLDFERAAMLRDELFKLKKQLQKM